MLLSEKVWIKAFQGIKAEKAAPKDSPPIRNWKKHAKIIAPGLARIACSHLCRDELNYQPDVRMCSLPGWPNPRNAPATRAT